MKHLQGRRTNRIGSQTPLHFAGRDTGIGIAPEVQDRIFETSTQADSSTTQRFGGSGLGLSIVRCLVSIMDGQLKLQSVPGQGSAFSVMLPFDVPDSGSSS